MHGQKTVFEIFSQTMNWGLNDEAVFRTTGLLKTEWFLKFPD